MRLRKRLSDELQTRLLDHVPGAVETVWEALGVAVAIEALTFKSAGGFEDGWERKAVFSGAVAADLHADAVDDLALEPLIADLAIRPIFLPYASAKPIGPDAAGEKARAKLLECRDTLRDQAVVTRLRFSVEGVIASYLGTQTAPELLASRAPEIGTDHADAYTHVGGDHGL
ncbi:MAG: hypothetical protein AAF330_02070 [Pseudomonadota bacterium]